MEQNMPVIAKKFWNLVRVAFFMLRKGMSSKRKFMLDLNLIMKRGKIAGKAAIQNLLIFHNTHNWSSSATAHNRTDDQDISFAGGAPPPNEYEFSCSNSPAYPFKRNKKSHGLFSRAHATDMDDDVYMMNAAVMKALEMLQSETASPALPGFGRTPMVRQLRVTDSPFPLRDFEEDHCHVDEAAENFISKFYRDLRGQASPCA